MTEQLWPYSGLIIICMVPEDLVYFIIFCARRTQTFSFSHLYANRRVHQRGVSGYVIINSKQTIYSNISLLLFCNDARHKIYKTH